MKIKNHWRAALFIVGSVFASFGVLSLLFATVQAGVNAENIPTTKSGIHVIESNRDAIILELRIPAYNIVDSIAEGHPCQILQVEGFSEMDVSGSPRLPVTGVMLGIPISSEPRIEILNADLQTIPDRNTICPVDTPIIERKIDAPDRYLGEQMLFDQAVYNKNELIPVTPVDLVSTGFVRSQRVVNLKFVPFQYNPVTGKLQYYSRIVIKINQQQ